MVKKRYLFIILLLFLIGSSFLFGAIFAEYIAEPGINFVVAPGPYTSPTVLGTKIGTFRVTATEGDQIYSPVMLGDYPMPRGITVTGPMKSWSGGGYEPNSTQTFSLAMVSYHNGYGSAPTIQAYEGALRPVIGAGAYTIQANPYFIELYLVNIDGNDLNANKVVGYRPASFFQPGAVYTLPSSFSPWFGLALGKDATVGSWNVADAGGPIPNKGQQIPVNGSNDIPILTPGSFTDPGNTGSSGVIYGDSQDPGGGEPGTYFFAVNQYQAASNINLDYYLTRPYETLNVGSVDFSTTGDLRYNTYDIKIQPNPPVGNFLFSKSGATSFPYYVVTSKTYPSTHSQAVTIPLTNRGIDGQYQEWIEIGIRGLNYNNTVLTSGNYTSEIKVELIQQ